MSCPEGGFYPSGAFLMGKLKNLIILREFKGFFTKNPSNSPTIKPSQAA